MDIKLIETKEYTEVLMCIKSFYLADDDKDTKGRLAIGDSVYCDREFFKPILVVVTDESDLVLNDWVIKDETINQVKRIDELETSDKWKESGWKKIIASNSLKFTPNSFISKTDLIEIISFYNEYGNVPSGIITQNNDLNSPVFKWDTPPVIEKYTLTKEQLRTLFFTGCTLGKNGLENFDETLINILNN